MIKVLIQIFFAFLSAIGLTAILVAWLLWRKDLEIRRRHEEFGDRSEPPLGI